MCRLTEAADGLLRLWGEWGHVEDMPAGYRRRAGVAMGARFSRCPDVPLAPERETCEALAAAVAAVLADADEAVRVFARLRYAEGRSEREIRAALGLTRWQYTRARAATVEAVAGRLREPAV